MTKYLAAIILFIFLSLTACANTYSTGSMYAFGSEESIRVSDVVSIEEDINQTDAETADTAAKASTLLDYSGIEYIINPDNYSITFQYFIDGEDQMKITCSKTAEGYYLLMDYHEYLYLKKTDGEYELYDRYIAQDDPEREFKKDKYKNEEIIKENVEFMMLKYSGFIPQDGFENFEPVKDGSERIAGRSCDRYTYVNRLAKSALKYTFCFDEETGVCLKYTCDDEGQDRNMTVECTWFQLGGVTLPKH